MTALRWTVLVLALVAVAIAGVMLGTMRLPPADVLRGLLGRGSPIEVAVVRGVLCQGVFL